MSLGYEFAPIDVSIITHDKVLDIDRRHRLAAFGLWCWGQCYARTHKTGGVLRRSAVLASLAASVVDLQKLAAELVRVGLWTVNDSGWDIHNFEKKSAGRQRSEAPGSSTERVRRHRATKLVAVTETERVTDETACNGTVPVTETSISISSSVSSSSGESAERGPPPWFAAAAQTVADGTGRAPDDLPGRWLEYRASRERKNWAMNQGDAVGWLTAVMRSAARDASATTSRKRGAEITKQPYEEDAPWLKAGGED